MKNVFEKIDETKFKNISKSQLMTLKGGLAEATNDSCVDRVQTCYVDGHNYTQCNDTRNFTYTDGKLTRVSVQIC